MKKIFLTMSLAIVAMNLNAQLVVDSVGRVGIRTGNQTLSSTLTLKNNVNDDTNGTKILLDNGATLVIDGFTVNFDFLQPYPGSKIVLINGAKTLKPFVTPLGVKFVINNGSIE